MAGNMARPPNHPLGPDLTRLDVLQQEQLHLETLFAQALGAGCPGLRTHSLAVQIARIDAELRRN